MSEGTPAEYPMEDAAEEPMEGTTDYETTGTPTGDETTRIAADDEPGEVAARDMGPTRSLGPTSSLKLKAVAAAGPEAGGMSWSWRHTEESLHCHQSSER